MGDTLSIILDMAQGLLGKLSAADFLHRRWQKRPHFVRNALPDCGAWLNRRELFAWATHDDVESRLVMHHRGRWSVRHGPFRASELKRLPAAGWSLLVQGIDQIHLEASALLQCFSFIPHARLDDLMVSFAPPGGGVGPHVDSYDVFLLQGPGARRWRMSAQKDLALVEDAPLRLLKRFRATREWRCTQGDLLYLPPRYAHEGVALEDCFTLSVGFRAPRKQELATHFLEYLQDNLQLDGIYQDRDLRLQQHPGEISDHLLQRFGGMLDGVQWNKHDIRLFCGRYLTEPKPNIVFHTPRRAAGFSMFVKRVASRGLRLALPTRLLFCGRDLFVNGEHHRVNGGNLADFVRLADQRQLTACQLSCAAARLLYTWYRAGYVEIP